ncbi:phage protein [Vibrio phage pTD1]|uniref:Phage protein n=1 Tax=Vibrio phage pTD1 TaxID=1938577 RepID=A0A1Q2U2Z8_9CAUD|nr:phage protein [Vibrio phage pTD1]BAW98334.1 phage protein [Vibrio phage pTD1]
MGKEFIVGTMSTLGQITDSPELAMDRHIAYWFAARRSQGMTIGKTNSFEWVLMQAQGSQQRVVDDVRENLKVHFEELFERVEVSAEAKGFDNERDGRFHLYIQVSVLYNQAWYDLGHAVTVSGQTFQLINQGRLNATARPI